MVISRRRFADKLERNTRNLKKHVKGVQNFCFCQLSMQILWRRRCSRVVDLKLPILKCEITRPITPITITNSWILPVA